MEDVPLTAEQRRRAWVLTALLLTMAVVALAVALFMRRFVEPSAPPAASWAAVAFALVSPALAVLIARADARRPDPALSPGEAVLSRHLRTSGMLEGAAMSCALALVVGPEVWPLLAAAVPIAGLVARLPRAA